MPFVSTLPVYLDSFVEPGLRVAIDGTPFAIHGRTKPFQDSLETVLELRLQALDLTRYLPFVPMRLPFAVESARLSLALDVGFVRPRDGAPRLTVKGDVALEKLDVKEKRKSGACRAAVRARAVRGEDRRQRSDRAAVPRRRGLDLPAWTCTCARSATARSTSQHLAPGAATPKRDAASAKSAEPRRRRKPKPRSRSANKTRQAEAGPRFALDRFTLEKTAVHFRDESVEPAFVTDVRDIHVAVRGLSNAPGATATVEAGLHAVPGGTVTEHGTLRLEPLAASGQHHRRRRRARPLRALLPATWSPSTSARAA